MLASDISQPILYMYIYIYILPCDLLVDQLISELRGYGPPVNAGRASITIRALVGLLFHRIVGPIFCSGCNNSDYTSLRG